MHFAWRIDAVVRDWQTGTVWSLEPIANEAEIDW